MTLEETMRLADVKTVYGARRFYPIGQHPATYRQRAVLKRLYEIDDGSNPDVRETILYYERMLAQFELGEDIAKMHYIRMWKSRAAA